MGRFPEDWIACFLLIREEFVVTKIILKTMFIIDKPDIVLRRKSEIKDLQDYEQKK